MHRNEFNEDDELPSTPPNSFSTPIKTTALPPVIQANHSLTSSPNTDDFSGYSPDNSNSESSPALGFQFSEDEEKHQELEQPDISPIARKKGKSRPGLFPVVDAPEPKKMLQPPITKHFRTKK